MDKIMKGINLIENPPNNFKKYDRLYFDEITAHENL